MSGLKYGHFELSISANFHGVFQVGIPGTPKKWFKCHPGGNERFSQHPRYDVRDNKKKKTPHGEKSSPKTPEVFLIEFRFKFALRIIGPSYGGV